MSGANRSSYNRIMNNEISNKPCGCGNCEPMCTTCGRPWIVCKGECGCKDSCCCNKKVNFCEYGRMAHGCIRERAPECPMQAVIPSVVVESISNLKNLADCFVHVTSINTTFYIDDKHRTMITWAGPVEVDNYDYENNPLGLRSQTVYDFANNRAIYYNKTGGYEIYGLGGGSGETVRSISVSSYDTTTGWTAEGNGPSIDYNSGTATGKLINTCIVPSPVFTDDATSETVAIEDVYNALVAGERIKFNHVPVGWYANNTNTPGEIPSVDGVELSTKQSFGSSSSFSGTAFATAGRSGVDAVFGVTLISYIGEDEETHYELRTQGVTKLNSPI